MTAASPSAERARELRSGLAAVRERIERACEAAGRRPADLALVVVTKTYPATDVRGLVDLGVTDVGESRDQEAAAKVADVDDPRLRWHFIGRLQTNKARSVSRYAHCVHTVDRPELVAALARATADRTVPLDCLVQVSLDGDPSRGGTSPEAVTELADAIAAAPGLRVAGLMAVAPRSADPDRAFATLPALLARLRATHPSAAVLSAGMSGDLEAAVRHGATHLRVGSAVLGPRPLSG